MNDFTKQELISMRDGIVLIQEKCMCSIQMHDYLTKLEVKIEDCIDTLIFHEQGLKADE